MYKDVLCSTAEAKKKKKFKIERKVVTGNWLKKCCHMHMLVCNAANKT